MKQFTALALACCAVCAVEPARAQEGSYTGLTSPSWLGAPVHDTHAATQIGMSWCHLSPLRSFHKSAGAPRLGITRELSGRALRCSATRAWARARDEGVERERQRIQVGFRSLAIGEKHTRRASRTIGRRRARQLHPRAL